MFLSLFVTSFSLTANVWALNAAKVDTLKSSDKAGFVAF
jgi:hypothetical protein